MSFNFLLKPCISEPKQIIILSPASFVLLASTSEYVVEVLKGLITLMRDGTQLTFTCSKSTIETLEKDAKYVQS